MLLDDELAPQEIEERFLQHFAVVVEPHWKLLSPYINPNSVSGPRAKEEPAIDQLQRWREQLHPTYGDLVEILSRLYIQPPLPDSLEYAISQDVPSDDINGNVSLMIAPFLQTYNRKTLFTFHSS